MAYFPDLSFYEYCGNGRSSQNIGWLQRGNEFDRMTPSEETLDLLWSFCAIPVNQTRGGHLCDFCAFPKGEDAVRNGQSLSLGSAEIRVFSKESSISSLREHLRKMESGGLLLFRNSPIPCSVYAAPTLIYHYVQAHHYKPPDEFLRALHEGPRPPDQKYFELLEKLGLGVDHD